MPLGEKKVRRLTGLMLVVAVLITRLPLISRMLYEFDSVDFAVATFRFSIDQVTPHFPGYILHILFAKFLLFFISDVNLAFVWISILLSTGSVLFLWRAGSALYGERVGVIASVLWLFTPIFWFYGEVATAYVYEAFFASAFLYFGISLLRKPDKEWFVYSLFIALAFATGARQSSILFFTPCVIYILWKTRQPLKICFTGLVLFLIIAATWMAILFSDSGGIDRYFAQIGSETVYRSQSILFGNSFSTQLSVIAKVLLYLFIAALPFLIIIIVSLIRYRKRTTTFIKAHFKRPTLHFTILVAIPPFLFYIAIYFMKAGYLLNILPSIALISAVLLDQMTIWNAERMKKRPGNSLLLTRPLITTAAIRYCIIILAFDIFIFFFPFPWLCEKNFNNAFTLDSFNAQASILDPTLGGGKGLALNRLFSFSSIHGIVSTDKLHTEVLEALKKESADPADLIILDTWWHRWGYYYSQRSMIYDIRDFPLSDSLWVGVSQNYIREGIADSVLEIPHEKKVIILLREDHPSFKSVAKQLHLKRIGLPKYLDMYRITDEHFSLQWKNVRFVKE